MAWTYTLVFTDTAVGRRNQVRVRVGDTDTNRQLLQDEEIDHLLAGVADHIVRAVIASARAVLARFGTRPDSQRVGDVSLDWSGIKDRMLAIIAEYSAALATGATPYAGGISEADIEAYDEDTDIPEPVFHEDLHRHEGETPLGPATDDEDD